MVSIASVGSWITENSGLLIEQMIQHLNIALTSLFFGIILWVPAGLLIRRNDRAAEMLLGTAGIILTIPSLALLSLLIPIVGIGVPSAIVALTLYSALPIARNTYVGLTNVDPAMIEAGRGLGMTERQLLLRVRVPLALSVIMTGIRQAAVLLVAITTVAAFFGAGGLGDSIFAGIRLNNPNQVIGAALFISSIAIVIDSGLYGVQKILPGTRGQNI
ncbi:ABC transporter permease [Haladaptatus pallidirubidus]|uniref:ABC transporter permease n=1 Tax=Haladaptatus pallidirubidus TaxID=1008152 RepID=A0AAV3URN8_9EURY|nr:ABC transporter permease [Haladaptatus pallidirubidus]